MSDPEPDADIFHSGSVVYRTPVLEWVFGLIKVAWASGFCILVVALLLWMLLLPSLYPAGIPTAGHVLGAIVLAMVPLGVVALANLSEPRKLILREHGLWLGGTLAGRSVPYDRVRLLKLDEFPSAINKVAKLTLDIGRRELFVVLKQTEVQECFEALCNFCEGAAVVGFDDEYRAPRSAEHHEIGRKLLLREFRKRRNESLALAIALGAVAVGIAAFLALTAHLLAGFLLSHAVSIGLAVLTGGALWRYVRLRRTIADLSTRAEVRRGDVNNHRDAPVDFPGVEQI